MHRFTTFRLLAVTLALAGCHSFGPTTLPRDRFDYSSALGESWKRQTLLNIVKLRYFDLPMFLDVGQIVSGYSLETSVNAGAQFSSSSAIQGDSVASLGAAARFTDRPTITYVPMTGDDYLRSMLEPIKPYTVFRLIQSGYAAGSLMEIAVQSINGLRNRAQGVHQRPADPGFLRAIDLMQRIQAAGAIGTTISRKPETEGATIVFFRKKGISEENVAMVEELKSLLGLGPDTTEFDLVYSPVHGEPTELALQTRSLLQILLALSSYVEVPEEEVAEGRATPVAPLPTDRPPLLRIRSGDSEPDEAFFAVHYRDRWFWIDDTDWRSKAVFAFVMFTFTLGEGRSARTAPVLTIPTQ